MTELWKPFDLPTCLIKSTSYATPHYTTFLGILSFPFPYVQSLLQNSVITWLRV